MSVPFDYCLSELIYSLFSFGLFASFALVCITYGVPFVYGRLERTFCLSDFGGGIQRLLLVTFGISLEPPKSLPLYSFTHDAPANLLLKSLLLNIDG